MAAALPLEGAPLKEDQAYYTMWNDSLVENVRQQRVWKGLLHAWSHIYPTDLTQFDKDFLETHNAQHNFIKLDRHRPTHTVQNLIWRQ